MELEWDDMRWLQNAVDVSTDPQFSPPLPVIKAAVSLLADPSERPVLARSAIGGEQEDWTLLAVDHSALIYVRASLDRGNAQGTTSEVDDAVRDIVGVKIPLTDVEVAIVGVPPARANFGSGRSVEWRVDYELSSPSRGLSERFETSRMDRQHCREAAEDFLQAVLTAQT